MVIGKGMIAKKFLEFNDDSIIFFASGVSNSNEINSLAFTREEDLLKATIENNPNSTLVYFSSCDIENPKISHKPYYVHKARIEQLVINSNKEYYIFRLPQVVGKSFNPNTLMNFFVYKIKNHSLFELWAQTKKSIIDIDDVFIIISYIIKNKLHLNSTCNIINNEYISVLELVNQIEEYFKIKAIYTKIEIDASYYYDSTCINKLESEIKINFKKNYIKKLLHKYY
jgi:dTDP-4-dehydrorhamnose reductase